MSGNKWLLNCQMGQAFLSNKQRRVSVLGMASTLNSLYKWVNQVIIISQMSLTNLVFSFVGM